MQIDALLFDKDGTLFDFEASWAGWMQSVIAELARADATRAASLAEVLGFDLATQRFMPDSPVIAGTTAEIVPLMAPLLPWIGPVEIEARLERSAAAALMVPTVPLRPLLERFRGDGYALGVATNATLAETQPHLDAAGIADLLDYVAGSDSGFGGKPAPGMCRGFAEHIGCAPDRIVMVGDSLHDLRAGRAAGMRTVAVLTGIAPSDELAPLADAVLPDIGALPGWLSHARRRAAAPSG